MVVGSVWRDVAYSSEVTRIFGTNNSIRMVERGSYTAGWTPQHGGGTTGAAMNLLQMWQMQTAVIMDGTLPATPEMYAKGIPGTRTNAGQTLNETDAKNYAYAIGDTNWQKYVGRRPDEVAKVPTSELFSKAVAGKITKKIFY